MQDEPGSDPFSGKTGGGTQPPPKTPTASYVAQGVPFLGPVVWFMFYGKGGTVKRWVFGLALLVIIFLITGGWRLVEPDAKSHEPSQAATAHGAGSPIAQADHASVVQTVSSVNSTNPPNVQGVAMSANNATNPAFFAGNINNPQAPLYSASTYIYYGVPLPNSVTRDAFESFENSVSNSISNTTGKIEFTAQQVQLLAQALKDLDQRTSAIRKMPDGTSQFGSVVAGQPTVVIEAYKDAVVSYTNNSMRAALTHIGLVSRICG